MLAAVRRTIGPTHKIRIDATQAWTVPAAARFLGDWHAQFNINFVEQPVPIDPVELMLDLKRRVGVPLCVNEGLWREADAWRIIERRCGDYLCFSSYWVSAHCGAFSRIAMPRGPTAGRSANTPTVSSASPRRPAST